jgi:hypothetical protein
MVKKPENRYYELSAIISSKLTQSLKVVGLKKMN